MSQFLEFESEAAFESWLENANQALGYPNPATRTQRYTEITFSAEDGHVFCPVDNGCPANLLEECVIVNDETLLTKGWQSETD